MTEELERVIRFFGSNKRYFKSTLEELLDGSISTSSSSQKKSIFNKIYNIEDFGDDIANDVYSLPKIKSLLEQIKTFQKNHPTHDLVRNYVKYALKNLEYYSEKNFTKLKTETLTSSFVCPKGECRMLFNEEIRVGDYRSLGYPSLKRSVSSLREFNQTSKYTTNQTQNYKGDILALCEDRVSIFDVKEYFRLDSRLKFPYFLNLDDGKYHKTVDSNLGRDLHMLLFKKQNMGLFLSPEVEEFTLKISQGEMPEIDSVDIDFATFWELFTFVEYGFVGLHECNIDKTFIFKYGNRLVFKRFDFGDALSANGKIAMSCKEDPDSGYIYVTFEYNGEVFYIMSQREGFKKGNCAFLVESFFEKVKELPIDMDLYEKYVRNADIGSGKAMEMYVWNEVFVEGKQVKDLF